jgi:hypothetical protein
MMNVSLEYSDGWVTGAALFPDEEAALSFVASLELYGRRPIQYTLLNFEGPGDMNNEFPPEAVS